MHGLNGYKEVIDTVSWGLEQLGHRVTYSVNGIATEATNIVFGAQVMPVAALQQLPKGTIIYNFEQMRGVNQIREELRYCATANHFEVWDYSKDNLPAWHALGRDPAKLVPVGYAPILSRIPKAPLQDIDVLIYGTTGQRRLELFHALSHRGVTTLFVSGLYGAARDDLISRSKTILNVNLYDASKIFEIVRVSYLLANRKAVIAEIDSSTSIEPDMMSAVRLTSSDDTLDVCQRLIENELERAALEEAGFAALSQRDIRPALEGALSQ